MSMTERAYTQLDAPNLSVEAADGVRYAYRRYGVASPEKAPVLLLQHYRGNLDNWDPLLVDGLAAEREVILLDNAGVGGSSGITPRTITGMAHCALAFVDAMGLRALDVLGFSMGGCVAQEIALIRPQLVRRLVLAGTAPQGGRNIHGWTGETFEVAFRDQQDANDVMYLFFERTPASVAKGWEFVQRIFSREIDRDEPVSLPARDAQADALFTWGIPDETRLNRLAGITQPTLAANGDNDIMMPTPNTYLLAERLPNAKLSIYPNAGHGFLFQYPDEFAEEVNSFLG
jgi:pimeloyl-ACP methyl ester carboxylesterase